MEVIRREKLLGLHGTGLSFCIHSKKRLMSAVVIEPIEVSGAKKLAIRFKSPINAFIVKCDLP